MVRLLGGVVMNEKCCVIVGVDRALGSALARTFGGNGYRLALLGRRAALQEKLPAELVAEGIETRSFAADTSRPATLVTALHYAREAFGDPDVLIYTAGPIRRGAVPVLTPRKLLYDFRASVVGAATCAQIVVPAMLGEGRGTILFAVDARARASDPAYASCGIANAALRNLGLTLAAELGPRGLHVALVTAPPPAKRGAGPRAEDIARRYWEIHEQPKDAFDTEVVVG